MNRFIKKCKKTISTLLIVVMVLSNNQIFTFADSIDEVEILHKLNYIDYSVDNVEEETTNTDEQSVSNFDLSDEENNQSNQNIQNINDDNNQDLSNTKNDIKSNSEEDNIENDLFEEEDDINDEEINDEIIPTAYEEKYDEIIYYEDEPEEDYVYEESEQDNISNNDANINNEEKDIINDIKNDENEKTKDNIEEMDEESENSEENELDNNQIMEDDINENEIEIDDEIEIINQEIKNTNEEETSEQQSEDETKPVEDIKKLEEETENNEAESNTDNIELIKNASKSITEEEVVLEVASKNQIVAESLDGILLGYEYPNQTIQLDFNYGPTFEDSLNWVDADGNLLYEVNKFVKGGEYDYYIFGESGTPIYRSFTASEPENVNPYHYRGSGWHVQLPKFNRLPNAVWKGYQFEYFYDKDGRNMDIENEGTFNYAYQGSGDNSYTAYWSKVNTEKYDLVIDYVTQKPGETTYKSLFKSTTSIVHGKNVAEQHIDLLGYNFNKIDYFIPSKGVTTSSNILLTYDNKNRPIDMPDSKIMIDTATYEVTGAMPNHEVGLVYVYSVDDHSTYKLTINHIIENDNGTTENFIDPVVRYLSPEELVDISPATQSNIEYLRANVVSGDNDWSEGIYKLGSLKVDNEILIPTDKTDTSDNKGRFYALMPNQDVTVNYYYRRTRTTTPIVIEVQKQQEDGKYITSKTNIELEPSTGGITYTWPLANYENEGYGEPDIKYSEGSSVSALRTVYNHGIDGAVGALQFYVSDYNQSTITIKYNYNYDSSYWGIIYYYALDGDDDNVHGKVFYAASTSVMMNTNKYKKKGSYKIQDLLSYFDIKPDVNYKYQIYRNKTSGVGEYGEPFDTEGNIDLTGTLKLFVKFVEDPDSWIDINFDAVKFCSIVSGETSFHVPKGTKRASISFPVSSPSVGYVHVGVEDGNPVWIDKDGKGMPDILNESNIYFPYIEDAVSAYKDAVKPLPLVVGGISSNGRGEAFLSAHYAQRKYILTDRLNKILEIKTGADAYMFNNLIPGKTYKLYEALTSINVGSVGDILIEGAGISQSYICGVNSVEEGNYSFDETNKNISISYKAPGVSYALLDDEYNIVYDWTTNPRFNNLQKESYYIIVAKETAEAISANDDDAVRNGVIVWTGRVNTDKINHKLMLIGDNAVVRNTTGRDLGGGIAVYEIEEGKDVEIVGRSSTFWAVISNNVILSSDEATAPSKFTMPKEDVIIRNYAAGEFTQEGKTTLSVDYNDSGVILKNERYLLEQLNQDEKIQEVIAENAEVMHMLSIDRYVSPPSHKIANKVTPYEYSINVLSSVNNNPYRNVKAEELLYETFITFNSSMINNKNYESNADTFTSFEGSAISDLSSSALISLKINNDAKISYNKVYNLNVISSIDEDAGGQYLINEGEKVTSMTEWTSNITPLLHNTYDMSSVTATSEYNAVEYLYDGIFKNDALFDIDNEIIYNNTDLEIRYSINEERENAKQLLNEEIQSTTSKRNKMTTEIAKNTLLTAINEAISVRNNQTSYTVASINEAYQKLLNVKNTTFDPPIEQEVQINGNGGDVNVDAIKVLAGEGYNYDYSTLSEVTATRDGYTFVNWNTKADGKGSIVSTNTKVGAVAHPVLYAIWEEIIIVNTNKGGGKGGGGGASAGGAAGSKTTTTFGDVVHPNTEQGNIIYYNQILLGSENPMYRNSALLSYGKDAIFNVMDATGNISLIDLKSHESIKNRLVSLSIPMGNGYNTVKSYLFDNEGKAVTGFNMVDGNLFYYSNGADYGAMQKGIFYDTNTQGVYYANVHTGAIVTGWQNVDGFDRYFESDVDYIYDQFGNITGVLGYRVNHGKMLVNTYTPDGYYVDHNGVRVIEKPGN